MRGGSGSHGVLAWFALAAIAAGCAPLTSTTGSGGSSSGGACAKTAAALTSDGGSGYQQKIISTNPVAQSVVLTPGETISALDLKLEGFSNTNPSSLSGTANIYIVLDAAGGSTPTKPNCSPSGSASGCASSALILGSFDMSAIALNTAQFYSFPLVAPVTIPGSGPIAGWIILASGNTSTNNYIAWDGVSFQGNPDFSTVQGLSAFGTANWTAINQNMTFALCQ